MSYVTSKLQRGSNHSGALSYTGWGVFYVLHTVTLAWFSNDTLPEVSWSLPKTRYPSHWFLTSFSAMQSLQWPVFCQVYVERLLAK